MAPNAVYSDILLPVRSSFHMIDTPFNMKNEQRERENHIVNRQRQRYNSSSPLGKYQFPENARHRSAKPAQQICRMPQDSTKAYQQTHQQAFFRNSYPNNTRNSHSNNFKKPQQFSSSSLKQQKVPVRRHHSTSSTPVPLSKSTAMTCAEIEALMANSKKGDEASITSSLNQTAPLTCAEFEKMHFSKGSKEVSAKEEVLNKTLLDTSIVSCDSGVFSLDSDCTILSDELSNISLFSSSAVDSILEDTDTNDDTVSSAFDSSETLFDTTLSPIVLSTSDNALLKSLVSSEPTIKNNENQENKMKKDLLPLFNKTQEIEVGELKIPVLDINLPIAPTLKVASEQSLQNQHQIVNKNMRNPDLEAIEKNININPIKTTVVYNSKLSSHNSSHAHTIDAGVLSCSVAMPVGASVVPPSSVALPSPPNAWRRSISPSNDITHHFAQLMNNAGGRQRATVH